MSRSLTLSWQRMGQLQLANLYLQENPARPYTKGMKGKKICTYLGLLLVLLGIGAIVAGQLTCTKKEQLFEVGSVEATVKKETRCFNFPEGIGIAVIAAGAVLLAISSVRRKTK